MGNCVAFKCTEKDENDQPERSLAQPTRRAPRKVPILKTPSENKMLVRRSVMKHNTATTRESADNLYSEDHQSENRNQTTQPDTNLLAQGQDLAEFFKKPASLHRTEEAWNRIKDLKISGSHYRRSRGLHALNVQNSNIKRLKSYSLRSDSNLEYQFKSPTSVECQ